MSKFASTNPVLSRVQKDSSLAMPSSSGVMTVSGTALKTLSLLVLCVIPAAICYFNSLNSYQTAGDLGSYGAICTVAMLLGCAFSLVATFVPKTAFITGPLYSVCEGAFLGIISAVFEVRYPGVVFSAVLATFTTCGVMYTAYATGFIRATPFFKKFVMLASVAIFITYIINLCMTFFGSGIGVLEVENHSFLSYAVSFFICAIACFNLILDFDNIENLAGRADKRYEWVSAVGLMVTVVWMYIEILKLLAKIQSDN